MTLSLPAMLEAVLFTVSEPMEKKRLAALLAVPEDMLASGLEELSNSLAARGLSLIETAGDVELRTSPDAAPIIQKLRESELSRDLGKAGLETLAIILYQDGATRSDIDWIRGVNSTAALRSLLLRGLIERGEDHIDRRRARYTPTVDALAHLGVSRKEELPRYEEFATALAARVAAESATSEADDQSETT